MRPPAPAVHARGLPAAGACPIVVHEIRVPHAAAGRRSAGLRCSASASAPSSGGGDSGNTASGSGARASSAARGGAAAVPPGAAAAATTTTTTTVVGVAVAAEVAVTATAAPAPAPWWQRILPGSFGKGAAQQQEGEGEDVVGALMRTVNEAELEALLAAAAAPGARPLLVVFSAAWCGPCQLLGRQLADALPALRAAGVQFDAVKVDADAEPDLCARAGVRALPCAFFVGARGPAAPALRTEGLVPAAVVEDALARKSAVLGSDLARAVRL